MSATMLAFQDFSGAATIVKQGGRTRISPACCLRPRPRRNRLHRFRLLRSVRLAFGRVYVVVNQPEVIDHAFNGGVDRLLGRKDEARIFTFTGPWASLARACSMIRMLCSISAIRTLYRRSSRRFRPRGFQTQTSL